uniref:Uncharacterized protein n=1 Tax=Chromera velia CCMP2878 TaxID=1169474 RepID=A0A0G4EZV5_9ALVE|eukprot:Cvel_14345.t1-p1 / transcript=Cvel_14345.t1 / gene=Cvel_14345 / organism=Chromera_velia_CCMP2878 / gene_product=hypothetical protein / transcript_product=hypothetical protein / location=Cvel_scaffold1016:36449-42284(+) / protein_length=936 / sequence_SO=supercontig / SO=protein_coding / is_pseudo=false
MNGEQLISHSSLSLAPGLAVAHLKISSLLSELGHSEQAKRHAEKAVVVLETYIASLCGQPVGYKAKVSREVTAIQKRTRRISTAGPADALPHNLPDTVQARTLATLGQAQDNLAVECLKNGQTDLAARLLQSAMRCVRSAYNGLDWRVASLAERVGAVIECLQTNGVPPHLQRMNIDFGGEGEEAGDEPDVFSPMPEDADERRPRFLPVGEGSRVVAEKGPLKLNGQFFHLWAELTELTKEQREREAEGKAPEDQSSLALKACVVKPSRWAFPEGGAEKGTEHTPTGFDAPEGGEVWCLQITDIEASLMLRNFFEFAQHPKAPVSNPDQYFAGFFDFIISRLVLLPDPSAHSNDENTRQQTASSGGERGEKKKTTHFEKEKDLNGLRLELDLPGFFSRASSPAARPLSPGISLSPSPSRAAAQRPTKPDGSPRILLHPPGENQEEGGEEGKGKEGGGFLTVFTPAGEGGESSISPSPSPSVTPAPSRGEKGNGSPASHSPAEWLEALRNTPDLRHLAPRTAPVCVSKSVSLPTLSQDHPTSQGLKSALRTAPQTHQGLTRAGTAPTGISTQPITRTGSTPALVDPQSFSARQVRSRAMPFAIPAETASRLLEANARAGKSVFTKGGPSHIAVPLNHICTYTCKHSKGVMIRVGGLLHAERFISDRKLAKRDRDAMERMMREYQRRLQHKYSWLWPPEPSRRWGEKKISRGGPLSQGVKNIPQVKKVFSRGAGSSWGGASSSVMGTVVERAERTERQGRFFAKKHPPGWSARMDREFMKEAERENFWDYGGVGHWEETYLASRKGGWTNLETRSALYRLISRRQSFIEGGDRGGDVVRHPVDRLGSTHTATLRKKPRVAETNRDDNDSDAGLPQGALHRSGTRNQLNETFVDDSPFAISKGRGVNTPKVESTPYMSRRISLIHSGSLGTLPGRGGSA